MTPKKHEWLLLTVSVCQWAEFRTRFLLHACICFVSVSMGVCVCVCVLYVCFVLGNSSWCRPAVDRTLRLYYCCPLTIYVCMCLRLSFSVFYLCLFGCQKCAFLSMRKLCVCAIIVSWRNMWSVLIGATDSLAGLLCVSTSAFIEVIRVRCQQKKQRDESVTIKKTDRQIDRQTGQWSVWEDY